MNFCPYVCDRQKYIYLFGNLKLSPTRLLKIEAVLAMQVSELLLRASLAPKNRSNHAWVKNPAKNKFEVRDALRKGGVWVLYVLAFRMDFSIFSHYSSDDCSRLRHF